MEKENTERLEKLVSLLLECDGQEVAAAFAMLPGYRNDGLMIIVGATARVFAETFEDDNLGRALVEFKKMIGEIQSQNKNK